MKILEEYNTYALEDEMNFEREFYDIMMDTCLAGDGIGKLIECDEDYEWEETYFTLIHPKTGEPIPDPSTVNEFDKEYPNGYPIKVAEDFQPQPDLASGVVPEVKEITITKTDKTFFGTKLIPVNPKDLLLPEGADTWDYDELPWLGQKLKKNWHWLKDRSGTEEGDYDEQAVDNLKPTEEKEKVSTVPKIELVELWGKVEMPINTSDTKHQVREIIALYAIEKQELLGWIPNPYKGKRMFFHWQIMPMPHKARGKSIPDFARGIRDLVDSLLNNMVNRDTINAHPPFIYDEQSGFDPEIHNFGPQEFWGVNDKTKLGRLEMGNYSETRSQWVIEFVLGMMQKLFGVNDYTLGGDDNGQNKTARGIMAIIGEGNFSFDTMIAILNMTNKKFFEANIRMHAKMMEDAGLEEKVFWVTGSEDNPYRKVTKSQLSLNWNFIPRGTSVNDNQFKREQVATEAYEILSKNILFSPELSALTLQNHIEITQGYIDAKRLNIKLPTVEEFQKALVQMKAAVEMEVQKKQQIEKLKSVAKLKKGTPEGAAAEKVLADIEMSGSGAPQGGGGPQGARPGQAPAVGGQPVGVGQ